MTFNRGKLRKLSILCRKRDNNICRLCVNEFPTSELDCHHIDPKSIKPSKAYDLDNSIALCSECHLKVVHSSDDNHKQFRVIFLRWVRRKANREFNKRFQYRVDRSR